MHNPIFLIEGHTGEYSDKSQWAVRAFTRRDDAKKFIERLEAKMKTLGFDSKESRWSEAHQAKITEMRKLDLNFDYDYTGTYYYITEIGLYGEA